MLVKLTPYKCLFGDIKELSVDDSILERLDVDTKKMSFLI